MRTTLLLPAAFAVLLLAGCAWISKPYRYYDELPTAYHKGERYECVQDLYLERHGSGTCWLVPGRSLEQSPEAGPSCNSSRVADKVSQGTVLEIVRVEMPVSWESSNGYATWPVARIEDGPFKGKEVDLFTVSDTVRRIAAIAVVDPQYLRKVGERE